jgi:hypothetical protein
LLAEDSSALRSGGFECGDGSNGGVQLGVGVAQRL